ncbi:major facilitator transporter [Pseudomonas luteola]|uniref:Major facilitator transporter n=1 Tax=Pseudomonas luteola TaxID=47886 RepID=A0A2X2CC18_PSELU|nr:MFS transporter [Pseudomonas luteola]MCG7374137.1 MFS transporter [Pseudomonas luteola]SPZ04874.1 major facilitator transporter [Pseudomonas luteola]
MYSKPDHETSKSNHHNFKLLWLGQSLSLVGNQFLVIGLPLLAVQTIGASPSEAVLLPFLMYVPFLLFGLHAGALVDRLPKKATMIFADLVQMFVFTLVAILAIKNCLELYMLMICVFITGIATVFFQVAYNSFLPEIYSDTADIQKGNARLFFSESIARTFGPMLAGPIIALFAPPLAILINGASFLISSTMLGLIHKSHLKSPPITKHVKTSLMEDIRIGLKFVFSHPKIEPVFWCGAVYVLFLTVIETSLVLYCKDVLQLSPIGIGFVIGAAAAGFPIANLISPYLMAHLGMSKTLVIAACTSVSGLFLIAIFGASGSVIGLIAASVLHGFGEGVFSPTSLTLRQTETPSELLGRVSSVQRFMIWGAIPLGSLLTSIIIKYLGIDWTLWIGGLGTVLCLVPLLRRGILADLRTTTTKLDVSTANR